MSDEQEPLTISPKPWNKLDAKARRRVEMLISTLTESEAGHQHSTQIIDRAPKMEKPQNHPLMRFMFNSLADYVCGTFMGSTAGAQDVFRAVNLGPVADELDGHLAKPVGAHTLKTFIEEHRNTTVAHPTFDPKHVLKRVYNPAQLSNPKIEAQYREAFLSFMNFARIAHLILRDTYPLAAASEDRRWKPVDNSP